MSGNFQQKYQNLDVVCLKTAPIWSQRSLAVKMQYIQKETKAMEARIQQLQDERDELLSQLNIVGREITKYRGMVKGVDEAVIRYRA
jgi:hypothetical protein